MKFGDSMIDYVSLLPFLLALVLLSIRDSHDLMPIDSDIVNDHILAANTAVSAEYAGCLAVGMVSLVI
jgi:hypothetical protein